MRDRGYMKYVLNIIFFFAAGFIAAMDEGENNKIRVGISVGASRLLYVDKAEIDNLKKLGVTMKANEPCFALESIHDYQIKWGNTLSKQSNIDELVKSIKSLPLSLFVTTSEKNGQEFKKENTVLCSFPMTYDNQQIICEVYMQSQGLYFKNGIENLRNTFKKKVDYYPNIESQLLNDGILAEVNGKVVHGPNGFFPDVWKAYEQAEASKRTKQSVVSYFSYLKWPTIGLFVGYLAWILYKKG